MNVGVCGFPPYNDTLPLPGPSSWTWGGDPNLTLTHPPKIPLHVKKFVCQLPAVHSPKTAVDREKDPIQEKVVPSSAPRNSALDIQQKCLHQLV